MALGGILIGLLNIALWVAILLFIGAIVKWGWEWLTGVSIPANIVKLFYIIVGLIAIIMVLTLVFGGPTLLPRIF